MSRRHFEPSPAAVADARWWTSSLIDDLPDHIRDRVVLVVSELCTNALVHASNEFDVGIERSDGVLLVEVTDASSARPAIREATHVDPRGRGLRIVAELASAWGVTPIDPAGKVVWARFDLDDSR